MTQVNDKQNKDKQTDKQKIINFFIIENNDKSLSYVPDQVAEDLVNNLITFLNKCDQQQIPVELKIAM